MAAWWQASFSVDCLTGFSLLILFSFLWLNIDSCMDTLYFPCPLMDCVPVFAVVDVPDRFPCGLTVLIALGISCAV